MNTLLTPDTTQWYGCENPSDYIKLIEKTSEILNELNRLNPKVIGVFSKTGHEMRSFNDFAEKVDSHRKSVLSKFIARYPREAAEFLASLDEYVKELTKSKSPLGVADMMDK